MSQSFSKNLASCLLPTQWGEFQLSAIEDPNTHLEHIALTMGDVGNGAPVLARVHSECLTGDGFYSLRCDCGAQLQAAMKAIAAEGRGVIVYLRQEGRGIGLMNKIRAYALQDQGADTVEANKLLGLPSDARKYDGVKMLFDALHIKKVRLMSNNPKKIEALENFGIEVTERVPLHVGKNPKNLSYIATKVEKMGHFPESEHNLSDS